jgi:hypothetical protein
MMDDSLFKRFPKPDDDAIIRLNVRIGGGDPNHHPRFAPLIPPAPETGVEALVVAPYPWLAS